MLQTQEKLFISLFLFGTASKKSKLINNNNKLPQQHQQHQNDEHVGTNTTSSGRFNNGKVHQQQQTRANTLNSPVDVEPCANQDQESLYNGSNGDLRGPRLVNRQLVLPIIAFPSNGSKDSNHLIKPSEYLKSIITDKRMITGNRR